MHAMPKADRYLDLDSYSLTPVLLLLGSLLSSTSLHVGTWFAMNVPLRTGLGFISPIYELWSLFNRCSIGPLVTECAETI